MRLIARIVLTLIALAALVAPAVFGAIGSGSSDNSAADPVTITDYTGDFVVTDAGDLNATETITADFPSSDPRHGIFRFFDTRVRGNSAARLSYQNVDVTLDGASVPVSFSTEGDRYYVAKIGDPDIYVTPGSHVYTISYHVPGALFAPGTGTGVYETTSGTAPANPDSVFYWNVVASGWRMPIERATTSITLPVPAAEVACSAGTVSGTGPCTIEGVGSPRVTVSAAGIPPDTGMTVLIPLVGIQPSAATLPWPATWDPVLGHSVPLVAIILVATLLAAALGGWWDWTAREPAPGLPVMYAPPQGLGPVQTIYVIEEGVGEHALLASLLRAADLGLVRFFSEGNVWTVQGVTYPQYWEQADPVTRSVCGSLGLNEYGGWVTTNSSVEVGHQLKSAQDMAARTAASWAKSTGTVVTAPGEKLGRVVWLVCLVLAIAGLSGWLTPTMYGLPFAAFAIAGLGLTAKGVGTRRTAAGRRLWSEAGGFQRMLSTPSSEQRFDFAAKRDLFVTYLPFAVGFGVADAWAAKYRTEMGTEPPIPLWYPYGVGYGSHSLFDSGGGFDSFNDSLSSAISTYEASQSSSSSGGGGGGFGGGGGGGGGGSW